MGNRLVAMPGFGIIPPIPAAPVEAGPPDTIVLGMPHLPFSKGRTARFAPAGASPAAVANTTCVLSGDQSGCVALRAPRLRFMPNAPVARSTVHILPAKAAITVESSGEMVAKPWPLVLAICLTS